MKNLTNFEKLIGYHFENKINLVTALTHISFLKRIPTLLIEIKKLTNVIEINSKLINETKQKKELLIESVQDNKNSAKIDYEIELQKLQNQENLITEQLISYKKRLENLRDVNENMNSIFFKNGDLKKFPIKQIKETYERLEFFGDSILYFLITEFLLDKYQNFDEGKLTKIRIDAVNKISLTKIGKKLNIENYLLIDPSVFERTDISNNMIEDSVEALIGAIYIDGGIEQARKFISKFFISDIEKFESKPREQDYKSRLFEELIKYHYVTNKFKEINYKEIEIGQTPNNSYISKLYYCNNLVSEGKGSTKKSAQQEASKKALEILELSLKLRKKFNKLAKDIVNQVKSNNTSFYFSNLDIFTQTSLLNLLENSDIHISNFEIVSNSHFVISCELV